MARKTNVADLEAEAIGYMPRTFVLYYYELVSKGMKLPGAARYDGNGGGHASHKYHTSDGGLKSDEALQAKHRVDRTLRQMVRDMTERGGDRSERLKCLRCSRYMQAQWKFCAWCANPTEVEKERGPFTGVPLR